MLEVGSNFVFKTYAKINLFLDVIGDRDDGYHNIVSLFQNISLYDLMNIEIIRSGLKIESNVNIEDNILDRVYENYCRKFGEPDVGFKIALTKHIPIGGGFGGGSSNAAAFIDFLCKTGGRDKSVRYKIASEIGSDVPFFLDGGTAFVKGRGEMIEKLNPIKGYYATIRMPQNLSISTKEAYSLLSKSFFGRFVKNAFPLYEAYLNRDFFRIDSLTYNIFESVISKRYKPIKFLISEFSKKNFITYGMTGSGSGVYGISLKGDYKFVERGFEYEEIKSTGS